MDILLGTLNKALRLEQNEGSSSGGAIIAERVLKLMEIVLHEASSEADTSQVIVFKLITIVIISAKNIAIWSGKQECKKAAIWI